MEDNNINPLDTSDDRPTDVLIGESVNNDTKNEENIVDYDVYYHSSYLSQIMFLWSFFAVRVYL